MTRLVGTSISRRLRRPTPTVQPGAPEKTRAFGPRATVKSIAPGRSKQVPRRSRRLRRPQHVIAARVGAGIVVLLVAVTLVTSFTASTNVPVSHAGTSAQARTIMQLAPAGCSSLALTVLVQGSGTFSNSQSHALVLCSAGSTTITDTGTGNCIVGGGAM